MDDLKEYLDAAGVPLKEEADRTAYNYYDKDGNYIGSGWVNKGDSDPVGQKVYRNSDGTYSTLPSDLTKAVDTISSSYTPKIKIKDDGSGLILSGSKTALQSDLANELRGYLSDALQYQDLKSENVAKIIEELNADIADQVRRSVVENGVKGDYEAYKDYAHTMEVMTSTNPMKKTGDKNKIAGYTKDGKVEYKTPQEWIDYYRENYSSTERANLFSGAALLMSQEPDDESKIDFRLWTPYLVMSGGEGGDKPLYGFDAWEKIQAGATEFMNEASAKLIEGMDKGVLRATSFVLDADGYRRRNHLNDIAKGLGRGDITSDEVPWISEEEYNKKINDIIGKKYDDLTDGEKGEI